MYEKAAPKEKSPDDGNTGVKSTRNKNTSSKMQVKSTFAAHDRTQLETVFDYPVVPGMAATKRKQKYVVEAWFSFHPKWECRRKRIQKRNSMRI